MLMKQYLFQIEIFASLRALVQAHYNRQYATIWLNQYVCLSYHHYFYLKLLFIKEASESECGVCYNNQNNCFLKTRPCSIGKIFLLQCSLQGRQTKNSFSPCRIMGTDYVLV